jgi:hypothetical protein
MPGAFLILLRTSEDTTNRRTTYGHDFSGLEFEVLLQCRSECVRDGNTWGLPGGALNYQERKVVTAAGAPEGLCDRVWRGAAMRESKEEIGGSEQNLECTSFVSEAISIDLKGGDPESIFMQRKVECCCLPAGLAFFEVDAGRSCKIMVNTCDYCTACFVYVLNRVRDGTEFCAGGSWRPRAQCKHRWEVNEARGADGYEWFTLRSLEAGRQVQQLGRPEKLCPWARDFFETRMHEVVRAARALTHLPAYSGPSSPEAWSSAQLPDMPAGDRATWNSHVPDQLLMLASQAAKSCLWEHERDGFGYTLREWESYFAGNGELRQAENMQVRANMLRNLFEFLRRESDGAVSSASASLAEDDRKRLRSASWLAKHG